jgi:hypothetical protein
MELEMEAASAIFALPQSEGAFDPEQADYLRALGRRRQSVLLAFAPKCGGTFLRSAAIHAVDGKLTRIVHAQGGRDATPYLPSYILYLAGGFPERTLVTHVHMQALPANRHFVETLDLKPAIMLRSVPDMLVSYLDMLEAEVPTPNHWLNVIIPDAYPAWSAGRKADFIIDVLMPWYASYYATWLAFRRAAPQRVLVLRYCDFRRDAAQSLCALLQHSGLPRSDDVCELAVAAAWREKEVNRFNRGEEARGRTRFTPAQHARITRFLTDYFDLGEWRHDLLPD